jgi:hypothetical protein
MNLADQAMYQSHREQGLNILVPWWLMAAYAYEVDSDPILSDGAFDWLSRQLEANWDQVEHHHKHFIDGPDCKSGTAMVRPWRKLPARMRAGLFSVRELMKDSA